MNYKAQNHSNLPNTPSLRGFRAAGIGLLLSAAAVLADEKPGVQDPAAPAAAAAPAVQ